MHPAKKGDLWRPLETTGERLQPKKQLRIRRQRPAATSRRWWRLPMSMNQAWKVCLQCKRMIAAGSHPHTSLNGTLSEMVYSFCYPRLISCLAQGWLLQTNTNTSQRQLAVFLVCSCPCWPSQHARFSHTASRQSVYCGGGHTADTGAGLWCNML